MSDIHLFLPHSIIASFHQLPLQLRRHKITTNELLTWSAEKVAKRCFVSPAAIEKLKQALLDALGSDFGVVDDGRDNCGQREGEGELLTPPPSSIRSPGSLRKTGEDLVREWRTISLLDEVLDKRLGGGIGVGQVTEVCGERYVSFIISN